MNAYFLGRKAINARRVAELKVAAYRVTESTWYVLSKSVKGFKDKLAALSGSPPLQSSIKEIQ